MALPPRRWRIVDRNTNPQIAAKLLLGQKTL
jgi:hypothetical protein